MPQLFKGESSRKKKRSKTALRHTSFRDIEFQVWRLQAFLTVLVGIIAVLPPSIFFVLELSHFRMHADSHATHFGRLIASQVEKSSLDVNALSSLLEREMEADIIASFQLIGQGGGEVLRVGQPDRPFFSVEGVYFFPADAAPLQQLRVKADDRSLIYRAARVVGIHFTVATLLAFAIYHMGVRSLHRAVDELEATQAQLVHSDKLSAIGEIYTGLTHEINNPLGIILSRVELLRGAAKEKQLSSELVRDLEMIHRHGTRIAEIVRGLLAFARRTSFDVTDTDLNHVIEETVSLVDQPFSKSQIRIERLLDRNLPLIAGSPPHLQQVFLNLLNNARDAMPHGGTITLRTYRNGRTIVAEVQDTGTGIAHDIKERIFEPFFTTKGVGKGTGLGLSVSYGIVRSHGGDIEVESNPGEGALFRVTIPFKDARS